MKLMPETIYNQFPSTIDPFMKFNSTNRKYSLWLERHSYFIFYRTELNDFPNGQTLDDCEQLFDKNVLPITQLVKDIGDLDKMVIKETKIFYLYDDCNLISNTFFTELNKQIQCYGFISLLYNSSDKHLISSKNRLKFNVLHNDQREYITLQLEDILTPTKIQTTDSQIYNLSMITKGKNYKIIDQIIIEGFQNFAQYEKINPVDIRLTDAELHSKLLYYSKKYKYRFLANNLLFSSAIEGDISTIFITTNG